MFQVDLSDLEFVSKTIGAKIRDAKYTISEGGLFKPKKEVKHYVWKTMPRGFETYAYFYSLLKKNTDEDTENFPCRIKYINHLDYHRWLINAITIIKEKAVNLDSEDEAYIMLKYLHQKD